MDFRANIIVMKILSFLVFVFSLGCVVFTPASSYAQVIGQYTPADERAEEEELEVIVARVFSSKFENPNRGQQLDRLYHNLNVTLAAFSAIDDSYKGQLWELMRPYNFQLTRRAEEFKPILDKSLEALNDNYKSMQGAIKKYEQDSLRIIERLPANDKQTAEQIWKETMALFNEKSGQYFKLQHQYLNTYRALVKFILGQNGSYFYDSPTDKIGFYGFGVYNKYANLVDKLNKIHFKQGVIARKNLYGSMIVTD